MRLGLSGGLWLVCLAAASARGGEPLGEPLGERGIRHAGHVTGLAFSPDGGLLATCAGTRYLRLWRMPGGKPQRVLEGTGEWGLDVAFSPGGDALALAGSDATVTVWEVATGTRLYRDRSHLGEVQRVAWLPDGRLVSGGRSGLLIVHDVVAGATQERWKAPDIPDEQEGTGPDFSQAVFGLHPHPGEPWLLAEYGNGVLRVWDTDHGTILGRAEKFGAGSASLRPGTDRVVVATVQEGGGPGQFQERTLPELKLARVLERRPEGHLQGTAVSPDGRTFAEGNHGRLVLSPLAAGGSSQQVRLDGLPVARPRFDPSGGWIAYASGPEVRLMHRATGTMSVASEGHREGLVALRDAPGGGLVSIGSYQELKVWDLPRRLLLRSATPLHQLPRQGTGADYDDWFPLVRGVPTDTGAWLLVAPAGLDGVELHDELGMGSQAFWPAGQPTSVAAAAGADIAAVGSAFGAVRLLRPSRPRAGVREVRGNHGGQVTALAFSRRGRVLLSGGRDHRVRRIDTRARTSTALPAAHVGPVTQVAVSDDGRIGASGSLDRTVVLWDLRGDRVLSSPGADGFDLTGAVALSERGDLLAAGAKDGTVRIYAVPDGELLGTLEVGVGPIGPVHFAAGSQDLLTATADGLLRRVEAPTWRREAGLAPRTVGPGR